MDTNQTHETSTPDADNCGALRTISGQEIQPVGLPVWNGIGQPGGVMPLYGIDKDGIPHRTSPLPEATFKGLDERPTPLSDRMREHLHMQFPATVGHIRLTTMLDQVADLERDRNEWKEEADLREKKSDVWKHECDVLRAQLKEDEKALENNISTFIDLREVATILLKERDNALSDFRQADTDSIRALHERNEAREQRDRLADALRDLAEAAAESWGKERPCVRVAFEALTAVKGGTQ